MTSSASEQSYLDNLLYRIPSLTTIIVTNIEGYVLLKSSDESLPESRVESSLSTAFNTASEQAGKLQLGANTYIICEYTDWTLLQLNLSPIIVHLISAPDVNLGLLINAIPELKLQLEGIRAEVAKHQQQEEAREHTESTGDHTQ